MYPGPWKWERASTKVNPFLVLERDFGLSMGPFSGVLLQSLASLALLDFSPFMDGLAMGLNLVCIRGGLGRNKKAL